MFGLLVLFTCCSGYRNTKNCIHEVTAEEGTVHSLFCTSSISIFCAIPIFNKLEKFHIIHFLYSNIYQDGIFKLQLVYLLNIYAEEITGLIDGLVNRIVSAGRYFF